MYRTQPTTSIALQPQTGNIPGRPNHQNLTRTARILQTLHTVKRVPILPGYHQNRNTRRTQTIRNPDIRIANHIGNRQRTVKIDSHKPP